LGNLISPTIMVIFASIIGRLSRTIQPTETKTFAIIVSATFFVLAFCYYFNYIGPKIKRVATTVLLFSIVYSVCRRPFSVDFGFELIDISYVLIAAVIATPYVLYGGRLTRVLSSFFKGMIPHKVSEHFFKFKQFLVKHASLFLYGFGLILFMLLTLLAVYSKPANLFHVICKYVGLVLFPFFILCSLYVLVKVLKNQYINSDRNGKSNSTSNRGLKK
jgi:hypothetical protein